MNLLILTGRIAQDIELKTTSSGTSVCRLSVAVPRSFKNANGEQETDFFNVVCWKTLAENCAKYLSKGQQVAVVGSLQNRRYEIDGETKYSTEVIASSVEFLGSNKNNASKNSTDGIKRENNNTQQSFEDDDLPF